MGGLYGGEPANNGQTKTGQNSGAFNVVPEVVRRGALEVGRFEVTQAQFLKFRMARPKPTSSSTPGKTAYTFVDINQGAPGGASMFNGPAIRISLEDATAYVGWLSKLTGQTWRLPYEDEVKDLYVNRDGENTLDYWAGYAPNPEDAARLREMAKELEDAPLWKEVGSFRGQGKDDEEPIYDLGGNVAEWVLTRDGKGKVTGGSADCPASPEANCTPAPEYIGFRVARGPAKPAPTTPTPAP